MNNIEFNIKYILDDNKAIISINGNQNTIEYDRVNTINELAEVLSDYINEIR